MDIQNSEFPLATASYQQIGSYFGNYFPTLVPSVHGFSEITT